MNVFMREIKANRKSLIIWCIGVFLLIASGMGKYAGFYTSGQSINDLLAQMPESLKAVMGMGIFDLSTAIGYYGVLFAYLAIMAAIHAAMLGASIISKEERDKTAEFLFLKPVSRSEIITAKLMASLSNVMVFNLVTFASSFFMVGRYDNDQGIISILSKLMLGMFFLQVIFLFMGTAIASVSRNPKSAPAISTGILLVTFVLSILIDINGRIEILKYLTPFKYFDAKSLIYQPGFDSAYVVLSILLIVVFLWATYVFYKKRDLHV